MDTLFKLVSPTPVPATHSGATHTAYNVDAFEASPPNATSVPLPLLAVFHFVNTLEDEPVPFVIAHVLEFHDGAVQDEPYEHVMLPPAHVPVPPLELMVMVFDATVAVYVAEHAL